MTGMQAIGEIIPQVLQTMIEAQALREQGNPVVYCPVCKADTVEKDGRCLWCDARLSGSDGVARSGGRQR